MFFLLAQVVSVSSFTIPIHDAKAIGTFLSEWRTNGNRNDQFNTPTGVALVPAYASNKTESANSSELELNPEREPPGPEGKEQPSEYLGPKSIRNSTDFDKPLIQNTNQSFDLDKPIKQYYDKTPFSYLTYNDATSPASFKSIRHTTSPFNPPPC